jgi:hypothetical protein
MRRIEFLLALAACCSGVPGRAQPSFVQEGAGPQSASVELEVLGNIRAQALGPGTVADLELPEDFLRRVADHVIRQSFEERYRIVVPDAPAAAAPVPEPPRGLTRLQIVLGAVGAVLIVAAVWLLRRNKA